MSNDPVRDEENARPLRERLTDYRDGLRNMADQIDDILAQAPQPKDREQLEGMLSLKAASGIYRIIADTDLTMMLNNEELPHWSIVVEVTPDEGFNPN